MLLEEINVVNVQSINEEVTVDETLNKDKSNNLNLHKHVPSPIVNATAAETESPKTTQGKVVHSNFKFNWGSCLKSKVRLLEEGSKDPRSRQYFINQYVDQMTDERP